MAFFNLLESFLSFIFDGLVFTATIAVPAIALSRVY
jgi:hypothetical protein